MYKNVMVCSLIIIIHCITSYWKLSSMSKTGSLDNGNNSNSDTQVNISGTNINCTCGETRCVINALAYKYTSEGIPQLEDSDQTAKTPSISSSVARCNPFVLCCRPSAGQSE